MDNLTEFTNRYMNNDHALKLLRLSYAIDTGSSYSFTDSQRKDQTEYDDIISMFKCHAEKNYKFLWFGKYYKIKLDICPDIDLFEIIEHDNIEAIHSLYEIFSELGYGFDNQRLNKEQADEVVEAINSYITSREVMCALTKS